MQTFREFIDLSLLGLPTVTRKGKIISVKHLTGKVILQIDDQKECLKLTAAEARRFVRNGLFTPGQKIEAVIQRHPDDKGDPDIDYVIQSLKVS